MTQALYTAFFVFVESSGFFQTRVEVGKRYCGLPNTFVELHVQEQVVRDS